VLSGLAHPKAKILAHPTGRLLNQRPGYELEWNRIFEFCKTHNKALEVNSWPLRLDLPDKLIHDALQHEIKFFINTDSHKAEQMDMMEFGVSVARRGWATSRDILNTLTYNELESWFKQ
jgi:DNA polymerase (family 10)